MILLDKIIPTNELKFLKNHRLEVSASEKDKNKTKSNKIVGKKMKNKNNCKGCLEKSLNKVLHSFRAKLESPNAKNNFQISTSVDGFLMH